MSEATYKSMYDVKPAILIANPSDVKQVGKEIRKNIMDQSLYTVNYLASGKTFDGKDLALGENKFVESGLCDNEKSEDSCKTQTKYTYIRNIPTGIIPPLNLSFFNVTGCNLEGLTEGRGLIPGLIEDVYDINPLELTVGATGFGNLGSNVCKKMTLPVGQRIYDPKKENTMWKWETRCTAGHNTMTETTDQVLNRDIRQKNSKLINARLPGPIQLRENYRNCEDDKYMNYLEISILICLVSFFIIKISKI